MRPHREAPSLPDHRDGAGGLFLLRSRPLRGAIEIPTPDLIRMRSAESGRRCLLIGREWFRLPAITPTRRERKPCLARTTLLTGRNRCR